MLSKQLLFAIVFTFLAAAHCGARDRWTEQQAMEWQAKTGWLVGCNFNPSTAINQLEMWQADTFDIETIDRELGWAEDLGFNSMRIYLHNLLWQQDAHGFLSRLDQYLAVSQRHGIGTTFVLLDGVWDPNPKLGKQRAPRAHVHNSGWLQAPGREILADPKRHAELKTYVQGVVGRFKDDPRIHLWDVFNEPDNPNENSYGDRGTGEELAQAEKRAQAMSVVEKVFQWAREMNPSQPLTAGPWRGDWTEGRIDSFNRLLIEQSDVISFHCYGNIDEVKGRVDQLSRFNRPKVCTEYMARPQGSTFDPILGYFKKQNIGAYNWGFVAGKTQTNYPWDSWQKTYTGEPELWFHEILRRDGTPYIEAETDYIKSVTK